MPLSLPLALTPLLLKAITHTTGDMWPVNLARFVRNNEILLKAGDNLVHSSHFVCVHVTFRTLSYIVLNFDSWVQIFSFLLIIFSYCSCTKKICYRASPLLNSAMSMVRDIQELNTILHFHKYRDNH